jgi:hypothetical protein
MEKEAGRRGGKWRVAGLVLLGLVAFLAFLLARAPADRIYGLAEPYLPGEVSLYGLSGSLWEGRATAVEAGGIRLHGLSWDLHTAALLTGSVSLGIAVEDRHLEMQAHVERELDGTLHLSVPRGRLAIPPLQGQTRWRHPALEGEVFLRELEATLADGALQRADGRITWREAAVTVAQRAELGDLEVTLETPEAGGTRGQVTELGEGPLEADGEVTLSPEGRWRVDAVVTATDPESVLGRSLAMMAEEAPEGGHRLRYSGRITLPSF